MKYMILTYGSQQDYDAMAGRSSARPDLTAADFMPLYQFMESFNRELADSGELVETRALAAPVHTRRIEVQGGVSVVTDGPYPETQEVLAGYWIVDCDGLDRALEIAGRLSGCPNPGDVFTDPVVDVRPIADSAVDLDL
jgi:hypothetical protein